jgi:protein AroM
LRVLENEVPLIILLCTAPFENLDSKVSLLRPASILERIVRQTRIHRLGVLTPSEEQIPAQRDRWSDCAEEEVVVVPASPYVDPRALEDAATELIHNEVDFVVMDCIGYTKAMKARIQSMMTTPIVSVLGALGSTAAEMLEGEKK